MSSPKKSEKNQRDRQIQYLLYVVVSSYFLPHVVYLINKLLMLIYLSFCSLFRITEA